jgi:hypothetical protein
MRSRPWRHSRSAPCSLPRPKGYIAPSHRRLALGRPDGDRRTTFILEFHDLRVWGQWSPIHLLSIFTLIMLPPAVIHAMRHRVEGLIARP